MTPASVELERPELVAPNPTVAIINDTAVVVLGVGIRQVKHGAVVGYLQWRCVVQKAILGVAATNWEAR